jgi:putative ABC transport system permease protein
LKSWRPTIEIVDILLGTGLAQTTERMYYRGERTKQLTVVGCHRAVCRGTLRQGDARALLHPARGAPPPPVVVLGETAYQGLFAKSGLDPIGKSVRIGAIEYTVVGVLEKAPSVGGFGNDQDDMVVIPQTTHQIMFSTNATRRRIAGQNSATIMIVPYAWATREDALADVEEIMRIRHGLKLDEPNDFDLATQDAILRVWDQISRATFLALLVISSIALMVGGIGVMAIMMISVTERTREIGVRKALGARRRKCCSSSCPRRRSSPRSAGFLGILCGSGHRVSRHARDRLPHLAALVVVCDRARLLGRRRHLLRMVPAVRASRLDPIEALRHE